MDKQKIIIAVSGASGSIYAERLLDKLITDELKKQIEDIAVVFSNNAVDIWKEEIGNFEINNNNNYKTYQNNSFYAPFASGSSGFETMIVCPCSMGVLGRIANGISNDLISRSADVILKERRKLILVTRETPLSLIHINNMKIVTEAGGVICSANPSFYLKPKNINDLVDTVVDRVLKLSGLKFEVKSWEGK